MWMVNKGVCESGGGGGGAVLILYFGPLFIESYMSTKFDVQFLCVKLKTGYNRLKYFRSSE